jgi:glycosyltransferase involved in cell wall biosynthesis
MRIGINASWMTPGQAGGMEWYVRNLIQQLGVIDRENEYVLVTAPNNHRTFPLPSPRWTKRVYAGHENSPIMYRIAPGAPGPSRRRFRSLRRLHRYLNWFRARPRTGGLTDLIRRERIQLWFCPLIHALPLDTPVPIVTTIPDLQHEYYPDFFSDEDFTLRAMGYQYSCRVATATIGISKRVADDIVKLYDVPPERVFSTPLALDQSYELSPREIDRLLNTVRLKFRIDHEFIFYPANGWKHKNHETLIEAFRLARERHPGLTLLLTGCEFDVIERIQPLIREYRLQHAVRHLGYVSREDVVGLYAACRLLVFPSLFEGFGLPLLEAMHFGAPVACSNVGSLPEVGGDAMLYFDPLDPEQIAKAINACLEDEHLRARLIVAGKDQARRFSYAQTAQQTLAIFEKIRAGELRPPDLPPFRPPIAHNWLDGGHSRWYFRARAPFTVHLEVIQPTVLDALRDQHIEVRLDGETIIATAIEPQRLYRFSSPCQNGADAGMHVIDITASAQTAVAGQVLSVQVASLRISQGNGKEMRLSQ